MKKIIFIISILALTYQSQSAVTNFTLNNASFFDLSSDNLVAWGSFAGPQNPSNATEIYNSCNQDPGGGAFLGCNLQRVGLDTIITVSFIETEAFTGNREGIALYTDNNNTLTFNDINSGTVTGPNQTLSMSFTWRDLCNFLPGGGEGTGLNDNKCDVNGQITLQFGVRGDSGNSAISTRQVTFIIYTPSVDSAAGDKNNFDPVGAGVGATGRFACDEATTPPFYGLCDYDVFPGDEKVSIATPDEFPDPGNMPGDPDHGIDFVTGALRDTVEAAAFIPNSGQDSFSADYTGLYIVVSDQGFDFTYPWNSERNPQTLEFTAPATSTLRDDTLEGLTNGVTYYFRAATLDIAGNVTMLFGDNVINAYCAAGGAGNTVADADVDACPFTAKPQLVVGLISETKCFITTATYGSSQAYQVKLFRKFREKFLWTNSLGLLISRSYNDYGPIAAEWIYKNPWSKKFVRAGLYPVYFFAYSSLKIGFFLTSLIFFLTGLGLFVSLKRWVRIKA